MELRLVLNYLDELCPPALAEDWDNTGLLIGSKDKAVSTLMTCLTLTPDVAAEALDRQVHLVVTHHPVLFRAVKKLTDETAEGRMILNLIRAGIAVYSPHTSYDGAGEGINRQIAQGLGLAAVQPIRPSLKDPSLGAGRMGDLPHEASLGNFCERVKELLGVRRAWMIGDAARTVRRVGIACGAASDFMFDAARQGCDVLLTGEARFHACLEARSLGIALVLPGHYATERPAMETLAHVLLRKFPALTVFASQTERDPIEWV